MPNTAEQAQELMEVLAPALWHLPMVFNSPHSGSLMPEGFLALSRLGKEDLRLSEDFLVDELFSGCVDHGAPLLRALASRAWLDLNREPYELDARMFTESLPGHMNAGSPRVAAGFGTIPRFVGDGLEIYRRRLPLAEALARIDCFYKPYHRLLAALLEECQTKNGFVLLVDCHSMPEAEGGARRGQPDIVLGDRFGAACGAPIIEAAEEYFIAQGLKVARNRPYAGGFITEAHGMPHHDRHALQIEVNRGLYMDERKRCPLSGFAGVKTMLDGLAPCLAAQLAPALRHAAE